MTIIHSTASQTTYNDGCEYREQLSATAQGKTLLTYLSQQYRHSTAVEWATRIITGHVLIDGKAANADSVLQLGSELIWQRPPWIEPDAPRSFSVLYEDEDLLVVAKPAGLPTLPGANFLQATLLYQVQRYATDATPLHRLGRWTSGLVLCARNLQARTHLMRQWTDKSITKRYRALASGLPPWNEQTINIPIGPVPHPLLGSVHAATQTGKPSLSYVTMVERRVDSFLCDVSIVTGRPHQIRIHLAAAGYPLAGDPLYLAGGLPAVDSQVLPGDPGYHLHAAELRFRHPRSGRELIVESEPPFLLRRTTEVS